MISAVLTFVSAVSAFALARAAHRRGWTLHAATARLCGSLLVVAAVFLAVRGGLPDVPPWTMFVQFAVNVLLAAVLADVARSGKQRDGAAR